jgi:hypothetical protein
MNQQFMKRYSSFLRVSKDITTPPISPTPNPGPSPDTGEGSKSYIGQRIRQKGGIDEFVDEVLWTFNFTDFIPPQILQVIYRKH